jgi:hypothetical protein
MSPLQLPKGLILQAPCTHSIVPSSAILGPPFHLHSPIALYGTPTPGPATLWEVTVWGLGGSPFPIAPPLPPCCPLGSCWQSARFCGTVACESDCLFWPFVGHHGTEGHSRSHEPEVVCDGVVLGKGCVRKNIYNWEVTAGSLPGLRKWWRRCSLEGFCVVSHRSTHR